MRFFVNRKTLVRLLLSTAGGLLFPLALYWSLNALGGALYEAGHERAAGTVIVIFLWPLFLADRIFPPPPHCPSCGPTDAALITAIIIYFMFYAMVTYIIQILAARLWNRVRHSPQKRSLAEGRA
jgi:hypothetical protein